jgi:acyl carrier protein
MKDRIISTMVSVFGVDQSSINEDASPDTIEKWDSINHMNLTLALEEEFSVNFTDDEMGDMMSYKLVELIIKEKLNNK